MLGPLTTDIRTHSLPEIFCACLISVVRTFANYLLGNCAKSLPYGFFPGGGAFSLGEAACGRPAHPAIIINRNNFVRALEFSPRGGLPASAPIAGVDPSAPPFALGVCPRRKVQGADRDG